ncbi:glycerol-3-phosphate acyltransferase [Petrotoga sp. 9PWA.NaAc.5.4]|uniref:glycerol-3-phosphate acyltransferase n=1 Tax=Petrotoga sp. 9PWA.NaAc.5.4 TaxID=1434328 RepID=UPI000CC36926|nr:glycerol-3-phosphate acyltransferase [Petrotoga sp. 9PWA.NaAc.5.4]PNR96729.1 phosphatidate cytidylyltransferase [Petrotoga sp. 9PWA.NaAc.5.4]
MKLILSLIISYFIGSIPWSFIFTKIFSGKDLRKVGTKNVGATNAWKEAGPVAGILSFVGDSTKGILAILIGMLLGISKTWWPLFALIAIIGHSFPIWLKGKGGVGVAAAVGSFVILFPLESAAFGILAGTLWLTFKKGIIFILSLLWPFVILIGYLRGTLDLIGTLLSIIMVLFLFLRGMDNLIKSFEEAKEPLKDNFVRRKLWRYMGLLFPTLAYPLWGAIVFRYIVIIAGLIALILELLRKYSKGINNVLKKVFKPVSKSEEDYKISGTSYFLMGCAIAGLFPIPYSLISIVMLVLGDSWAVLVGKKWGKHQWLQGKSIEGSIVCFLICLASGAVYMNLIGSPVSYFILIVGALSATMVEGLGNWLNDNLTMAPISALCMWLFSLL